METLPCWLDFTVLKSGTQATRGEKTSMLDRARSSNDLPGKIFPLVIQSGKALHGGDQLLSCLDLRPVPWEGILTWYCERGPNP